MEIPFSGRSGLRPAESGHRTGRNLQFRYRGCLRRRVQSDARMGRGLPASSQTHSDRSQNIKSTPKFCLYSERAVISRKTSNEIESRVGFM